MAGSSLARKSWLLALAIFLLAAVPSCGGGDLPARTTRVDAADKQLGASGEVVGCITGRAFLGKTKGTIGFAVRCWTPVHREVGFSLARYSLDGRSSKSGIRHFSRHPTVGGPGAIQIHGACEMFGTVLRCGTASKGWIRILGKIWVDPATRCSMGVALSVIEPSTCKSHVCPTGLVSRSLTSGRPRGC